MVGLKVKRMDWKLDTNLVYHLDCKSDMQSELEMGVHLALMKVLGWVVNLANKMEKLREE